VTRIGIRSQFVALSGRRRTRILEYRKATEGNAGSKENSHVMRRCLRHSAEPRYKGKSPEGRCCLSRMSTASTAAPAKSSWWSWSADIQAIGNLTADLCDEPAATLRNGLNAAPTTPCFALPTACVKAPWWTGDAGNRRSCGPSTGYVALGERRTEYLR